MLFHAFKRNFALTRLRLLPIRGSHWAPSGQLTTCGTARLGFFYSSLCCPRVWQ